MNESIIKDEKGKKEFGSNNDINKTVIIPKEREKESEPANFKDYAIYFIIGMFLCYFNMRLNEYLNENFPFIIQILSYLIIIGIAMIPGIIFGILKRVRGYSYLFGFMAGGLQEAIFGDVYIGLYTAFVSLMLFLIPYLIFKLWRSVSKVIIE
ncbi:MAG: hypothetical protein ACTSRZ_03600 [Promethearchaeota archaeon]